MYTFINGQTVYNTAEVNAAVDKLNTVLSNVDDKIGDLGSITSVSQPITNVADAINRISIEGVVDAFARSEITNLSHDTADTFNTVNTVVSSLAQSTVDTFNTVNVNINTLSDSTTESFNIINNSINNLNSDVNGIKQLINNSLNNLNVDLTNYYNKQETDSQINNAIENININNYYNKQETDSHISSAIESIDINNYYNKQETDSHISSAISNVSTTSGYDISIDFAGSNNVPLVLQYLIADNVANADITSYINCNKSDIIDKAVALRFDALNVDNSYFSNIYILPIADGSSTYDVYIPCSSLEDIQIQYTNTYLNSMFAKVKDVPINLFAINSNPTEIVDYNTGLPIGGSSKYLKQKIMDSIPFDFTANGSFANEDTTYYIGSAMFSGTITDNNVNRITNTINVNYDMSTKQSILRMDLQHGDNFTSEPVCIGNININFDNTGYAYYYGNFLHVACNLNININNVASFYNKTFGNISLIDISVSGLAGNVMINYDGSTVSEDVSSMTRLNILTIGDVTIDVTIDGIITNSYTAFNIVTPSNNIYFVNIAFDNVKFEEFFILSGNSVTFGSTNVSINSKLDSTVISAANSDVENLNVSLWTRYDGGNVNGIFPGSNPIFSTQNIKAVNVDVNISDTMLSGKKYGNAYGVRLDNCPSLSEATLNIYYTNGVTNTFTSLTSDNYIPVPYMMNITNCPNISKVSWSLPNINSVNALNFGSFKNIFENCPNLKDIYILNKGSFSDTEIYDIFNNGLTGVSFNNENIHI